MRGKRTMSTRAWELWREVPGKDEVLAQRYTDLDEARAALASARADLPAPVKWHLMLAMTYREQVK